MTRVDEMNTSSTAWQPYKQAVKFPAWASEYAACVQAAKLSKQSNTREIARAAILMVIRFYAGYAWLREVCREICCWRWTDKALC